MAFLHFDNVGIVALAGVLPEHVQKIDTNPAHPNAATSGITKGRVGRKESRWTYFFDTNARFQ